MSCKVETDDTNVINCVSKDEKSNIYIKNISNTPDIVTYVPAYKELPSNCVENTKNNNIICLENTRPEAMASNNNLKPYYLSELKKSGNYYVQSLPSNALQSNNTLTSNNTIVFENKDTDGNLDKNAPYCLITKCSNISERSSSPCSGLCISTNKDSPNVNVTYNAK
jgi:hypothetical protein